MVDEFMPFKQRFEMPEPLSTGLKPVAKAAETKRGADKKNDGPNDHENMGFADQNVVLPERESFNKILTNQEIIEKILVLQRQSLEQANYYLQLTYCDTTFCHRFVHFEVDPDYIEQFEPILNEYIDQLKKQELDGVLHYHLQEMPSKQELARMDPTENPLVP